MQLLNASGCLDALTAPDVAASLDAFVTKTVTPEPREGNAPVRIAETEFGMLNAIGLANPGRDTFLRETLPRLASAIDVPIWVSVGGFNAREYAETCEQLAGPDVACVELNLSCPNVDEAPESAAEIVRACREVTAKPLYAKVSPHSWDIGEGSGRAHAMDGDVADLLVPFMFVLWQYTIREGVDMTPFDVGIRVTSGHNAGDFRVGIGPDGMSYEQGDVTDLPCVLEFDPGSFVLTAFGRYNAGTIRGDATIGERFLNLFFRI